MVLADEESARAKILATDATTYLADIQDNPRSSEERKQVATAALENILADSTYKSS